MKRRATAVWKGPGLEGSGTLTGKSGVLDATPFSAKLRFENEDGKQGTNPEELIAAAHAGCFSMALSFALGNAGFTPDEINTEATIVMDKGEDGWAFTEIILDMEASIPEIGEEEFMSIADAAKKGCPVSKALSAVPISLNATLK